MNECQYALSVVKHIKKMIQRCKTELDKLESGHNSLPFSGEQASMILSERYEYLEGLQSELQFILDYPEREQSV